MNNLPTRLQVTQKLSLRNLFKLFTARAFLLRFRRPFDAVALRVAYTRPSVGHHCIVGNGMLSRVFVGLNEMLVQLSDD